MHPDLIAFIAFVVICLASALMGWRSYLRSRVTGREQRLRQALAQIQDAVDNTRIARHRGEYHADPIVSLLVNVQRVLDRAKEA